MPALLLDRAFRYAAARSMRLVPSEGHVPVPDAPVFLYLHVPFCSVLCPFCSFHRVRHHPDKARAYFDALRREIRLHHARGFRWSGVYVGGGTPTIEPEELAETLALVRSLSPLDEISVETNPADLQPRVLDLLVQAGVQRLSVGVQSFDDRRLRAMERCEKYGDAAEIRARLAAAAPRFRTLNVDMIYGFPGQSAAELDADLDAVLASPANQVSFYPLMSAKQVERRMRVAMGVPDRRELAPQYRRILARLRPAFAPASAWCFDRGGRGIDEYVIASPDYLGLGSGAFSHLGERMYASTFSLHAYVERVNRGLTGITGERLLAPRERMRYDLLMRLSGLHLERAWVRARYGAAFERALWPELALLRALGAITSDAAGWHLTERGMLLWVRTMAAFYEAVNEFRAQMRAQIGAELDEEADAADDARRLLAVQGANSGPLSMWMR